MMKRFTLPFLIIAVVAGIYGFGGFDLWATEAARIIFLIAADLFVVSLFAKFLFKKNPKQIAQRVES
ncbi:putative membrane protein YtjA (UPF0391 family) [Leeuwenhoekiella aestuarii]|uniref:Putative membrane protein YtjA (UPF0391 family) n=3 Tax=Leeuwenhoekiella TaxID=283735 RepID=A0A4Q0NPZ6_9FLAO|nr:DUF1328 family protein [Leeuwenhoekiella polynyae]RXG12370.1 putative membrane protein YtjA (UPF0391 family) [Leeuwenhoekiella aestuarii]RXG13802.1 putative membrane protein YtjA (UPF0391 family) [Leeuwenhoekiella aestuarii]RXG25214.1 putative membrane protein YtjA (UPF0391 family) [Leeuwenhoekiella polynyae]